MGLSADEVIAGTRSGTISVVVLGPSGTGAVRTGGPDSWTRTSLRESAAFKKRASVTNS